MKKIILSLLLVLLLFSCSENFKKKKIPPKSPDNWKEAKEVEKK